MDDIEKTKVKQGEDASFEEKNISSLEKAPADVSKDENDDAPVVFTKERNLADNSEVIKNSKLKLNDMLIPIFLAVALIMIAIFIFIPMIQSAISYRNQMKEIQNKITQLDKLAGQVESIEEETLTSDLLDAKAVIPRSLSVSTFISYVIGLAEDMGLTYKTLRVDDSAGSVSGPLTFSGKLDDILNFLDSVYIASPYLVSADNVEINDTSDGTWKVSFNLTGYYVEDASTNVDLYANFDNYTNYSEIVTIFNEKALKLSDK